MRPTAPMAVLAAAFALTGCIHPVDQQAPSTDQPSLSDCAKRASATASGGACSCDPSQCREGDVCTKVGRCGTVVDALARPAKVMLALDRSGSMKTLPESDTQWGCAADPTGNGYDPTGTCKWNQLKALVAGRGGLLEQGGSRARFGLAVYPETNGGADACGAGRVEVEVPAVAGQSNAQIASVLDQTAPAGGTPSAATLQEIAADAAFASAEASRYVVLVTDGQPNCNAAISACTSCTNGGDPTKMCGDVRNCLDDAGLVGSVTALRAKGIDTFVVGFGFGTASPQAAAVLDDAAVAGGRALDGERRYYQAGNAAELAEILETVGSYLQPCIYELTPVPADPDQLQVVITDSATAQSELLLRGSEWDYVGSAHDRVEVKGERCERIQAGATCRYSLEFLALSAP